eukprot:10267856-Lingulodinium_polyedra.AAC.1
MSRGPIRCQGSCRGGPKEGEACLSIALWRRADRQPSGYGGQDCSVEARPSGLCQDAVARDCLRL